MEDTVTMRGKFCVVTALLAVFASVCASVLAEDVTLAQNLVHQCGFTVIYMGNYRDVTDLHFLIEK